MRGTDNYFILLYYIGIFELFLWGCEGFGLNCVYKTYPFLSLRTNAGLLVVKHCQRELFLRLQIWRCALYGVLSEKMLVMSFAIILLCCLFSSAVASFTSLKWNCLHISGYEGFVCDLEHFSVVCSLLCHIFESGKIQASHEFVGHSSWDKTKRISERNC